MALIQRIYSEGGSLILQNVVKGTSYAVGAEDVRLYAQDSDKVQVQTETPEALAKPAFSTSAGELEVNGVLVADSATALIEFGKLLELTGPGGTSNVQIISEDVTKMHSFRNSKLVIGDTDDEVILFSFKKTGLQSVTLKEIQVNFLIISNDYAEIRFHRNPTYTGSLTYSGIQGSFMTGANGDDGSPSATQVTGAGVDVQSLGFIDQRNYGKELKMSASIQVSDNNDEFVFSAICGANDTKIYASINFIEV